MNQQTINPQPVVSQPVNAYTVSPDTTNSPLGQAAHPFGHATAHRIPNGAGAAAILAAGIGCLAVAVLALVADKVAGVKAALIFYRPTGPLSGVTTLALLLWLTLWALLHWRWRMRDVAVHRICSLALLLLLLAMALVFPPIADRI